MPTDVITEVLKQGGLLAVAVVAWYIARLLIQGQLIPRDIYNLERTGRLDLEKRFDRSMDLAEALLDELKKAKSGSA